MSFSVASSSAINSGTAAGPSSTISFRVRSQASFEPLLACVLLFELIEQASGGSTGAPGPSGLVSWRALRTGRLLLSRVFRLGLLAQSGGKPQVGGKIFVGAEIALAAQVEQ